MPPKLVTVRRLRNVTRLFGHKRACGGGAVRWRWCERGAWRGVDAGRTEGYAWEGGPEYIVVKSRAPSVSPRSSTPSGCVWPHSQPSVRFFVRFREISHSFYRVPFHWGVCLYGAPQAFALRFAASQATPAFLPRTPCATVDHRGSPCHSITNEGATGDPPARSTVEGVSPYPSAAAQGGRSYDVVSGTVSRHAPLTEGTPFTALCKCGVDIALLQGPFQASLGRHYPMA